MKSPLSIRPGQENVALHQGALGIQHSGKLMKKFFVLYPERLDYFETAVDAVSGQRPLGRIALAEVTGHEVFGVGLILDLLGRKVGLKADHDTDVKEWDAALKQAMLRMRPPGFTPLPVSKRARSSSPRKKTKARVYDFRQGSPCESCPHCGGCSNSPQLTVFPSPDLSTTYGSAANRAKSVDSSLLQSPSNAGSAVSDVRGPASDQGCSSSLRRNGKPHVDREGWVQINLYNRYAHAGGRPWANKDIADRVMTRESTLKDGFVYNHPVTSKVHRDWDQKSAPHMPGEAPVATKINVPDVETQAAAHRKMDEERHHRHLPTKITAQTKYGKYPNFTTSTDRVYLTSDSPDRKHMKLSDFSSSKITTGSPQDQVYRGRAGCGTAGVVLPAGGRTVRS